VYLVVLSAPCSAQCTLQCSVHLAVLSAPCSAQCALQCSVRLAVHLVWCAHSVHENFDVVALFFALCGVLCVAGSGV